MHLRKYDLPCVPLPPDEEERCIPETSWVGEHDRYADSACTEPIVILASSARCPSIESLYVENWTGKYFRLPAGDPLASSATTYRLYEGYGCIDVGSYSGLAFRLGGAPQEVPITDFPKVKERTYSFDE